MSVAYNTTLTNTIIPKWDMDLMKALYATAVIMPLVANKSSFVAKEGDRVEINIEPTLSVGTVTPATGAFTPSDSAPTKVNIQCNIWEYVSESITDMARVQAFWTAENNFASNAGKAFAAQYDGVLGALFASINGLDAVGSTTEPDAFSAEMATSALLNLVDANVPQTKLSWVLSPRAFLKGWLKDSNIVAAQSAGTPQSALITGKKTDILGHPCYQSTKLTTTSGLYTTCALLHKDALGIAMQQNARYQLANNVSAGALTHTAVCDSLYGTAVIRSNHGVRMYVKSS